ncbi:MAG TPA: methylmalonyl-CoA mutase family protein [Candidatus Binatia bacterium]|nr:methylmalonyl-CoA mutase family protein [Candidatus Binatia bacterium]
MGEAKPQSAVLNRPAEPQQTSSHIAVQPLYTPADLQGWDYDRDVGYPGQFPYTRGVQATMYRGRLWTMRQYAGMGDAEESNRRYRYLLSQGTSGLSVAFDLPTQIGLDSDHPRAAGEVGKVGVAIDSIEDMMRLFDGINLEKISTSMTINATASILLALYIVTAQRTGRDVGRLSGTIQNDVLKEYIARGTYIYPPAQAMRIITDIFSWANERVPDWNTISISGYHMREAGCTAVQEVAFTLANGMTYVQAAIDAGLDVDNFAPRLSFFFNAHSNFLEEVAKFRAARRMWARIMRDRFGARNPKSWMLRFHTQTAGSTLTAQQPENNIVRTALQALSAVLGGTQSLHTNSFDEALALPTEQSARVALRTQQIVAYESGVAQTIDPLAGSYYVEYLTNQIETHAFGYLARIEAMGGMLKAIERGFVQQEIQNAAYECQRTVDRREALVVGVNSFQLDEEKPIPLQRIDDSLERKQVERVRALRAKRDAARWQAALKRVEETARGAGNLMPMIVEAVEAHATVGEISDAMRNVYGEYQETVVI